MKNASFVFNNVYAEIHVITALESCGYRWTRNGNVFTAYNIDDDAWDVIWENAAKAWTW